MAGKADFTPDEWATMQRAVVGAPLLVAVSDGGTWDLRKELAAIAETLADARATSGSELVQGLADIAQAHTGFTGRMRRADVEGPALVALRAATATVEAKAPDELDSFKDFVLTLAKTTAAAARSGPFALTGPRVSEAEAAAVDKIKEAIGLRWRFLIGEMINPQHRVVIEYCVPWDYLDEAARGAAEILEGWAPVLTGLELRTGSKGAFKVTVDDRVVFDKKVTGRKPQAGEVGRLVEGVLGPRLGWRKARA